MLRAAALGILLVLALLGAMSAVKTAENSLKSNTAVLERQIRLNEILSGNRK